MNVHRACEDAHRRVACRAALNNGRSVSVPSGGQSPPSVLCPSYPSRPTAGCLLQRWRWIGVCGGHSGGGAVVGKSSAYSGGRQRTHETAANEPSMKELEWDCCATGERGLFVALRGGGTLEPAKKCWVQRVAPHLQAGSALQYSVHLGGGAAARPGRVLGSAGARKRGALPAASVWRRAWLPGTLHMECCA